MAQEKQTGSLYDFLYKDGPRLASYYAQMHGGKLLAVENVSSNKETAGKGGKLGIQPFAAGELSNLKETLDSVKETLDPHELITVDVLSAFIKDGRLNRDCTGAKHGELIHVEGTLTFVDRHMVEMASSALGAILAAGGPESESLRPVLEFMRATAIPSALLLSQNDGRTVVGTIKDAGMEEPITSYYFKFGAGGLADVHLIGIKEVQRDAPPVVGSSLLHVAQKAASALSDILFPANAIRVTPIAIFRKL